MIEHEVEIPSADGAIDSYVVHPDEGGPFPVVLFYMDAPGKREELHEMARRIAAVGYFVVLPNLYHRSTRDFVLRERTEAAMAQMFALMATLDRGTTERDTQALLDWVDAQPAADGRRIGAVGYCMSGPFVMWAAAAFPRRIACIASIHGANMVTAHADSPHRMAPRIRCESYFACAETDRWAPPADIEQLQAALREAGTPHRIEWYAGVEHGFVFPQRAGIYDRAAAERHWERLFDLFERRLRWPADAIDAVDDATDDERVLSLERVLRVPRAAVWRCWTEPALLRQWFCPRPWSVARAELDVRPGGRCFVLMQGPDGQQVPSPGVYLAVDPGRRLVFSDAFTSAWRPSAQAFMVGEIRLDDTCEGHTRYRARALHWNADDRRTHEAMGFHEGWAKAAEQLEALAATL